MTSSKDSQLPGIPPPPYLLQGQTFAPQTGDGHPQMVILTPNVAQVHQDMQRYPPGTTGGYPTTVGFIAPGGYPTTGGFTTSGGYPTTGGFTTTGGYPAAMRGYPVAAPPMGIQPNMGMDINNAAAIGAQYQSALLARCAQGNHEVTTSFGPVGIITAICLFPIGLICLFMDVQKKCSRCGVTLPR
ncbi:hypothetical protein GALMADRAFT_227736 [Galerina marginata CBS 339.88]|uniref:Uncharacterized protein n=1 Tax=Galerina marginata (strain CBS 339.88) TaxID=685588 RepID=A0A067T289_GALM3|nr:hypothetical protein GALMADRAFT_227736 [Galerina marginata CBS 339.88]